MHTEIKRDEEGRILCAHDYPIIEDICPQCSADYEGPSQASVFGYFVLGCGLAILASAVLAVLLPALLK